MGTNEYRNKIDFTPSRVVFTFEKISGLCCIVFQTALSAHFTSHIRASPDVIILLKLIEASEYN